MKWATEQHKVYVQHTGSSIYVAWIYTDDHTYYATDNIEDFMCRFDDRAESAHMENPVGYVGGDYGRLTEEEQKIFNKLCKALEQKGVR